MISRGPVRHVKRARVNAATARTAGAPTIVLRAYPYSVWEFTGRFIPATACTFCRAGGFRCRQVYGLEPGPAGGAEWRPGSAFPRPDPRAGAGPVAGAMAAGCVVPPAAGRSRADVPARLGRARSRCGDGSVTAVAGSSRARGGGREGRVPRRGHPLRRSCCPGLRAGRRAGPAACRFRRSVSTREADTCGVVGSEQGCHVSDPDDHEQSGVATAF